MKGKKCINKINQVNKNVKKTIPKTNDENKNININSQKKGEDKMAEQRKKDIERENKFRFDLMKKQYCLHLVKRDGNCLFSSISDQVYGTEKHSKIVREKCMDYIEKNKVFYSQFIEGGEAKMKAYIERKRKIGIWGDNLEIQALSEIYNRPIEIYDKIDKPLKSFCNVGLNKKFPIKISYHGKHYNSIVPSVRHKDYELYKRELLNANCPGVYETKFIKNYDPSKKLEEKKEDNKESLKNELNDDDIFSENDLLYQEAIEISKEEFNQNKKNESKIGLNQIQKNNKNDDKKDLNNPIVKTALELGFSLEDAIEAVKLYENDQELAINYLCNKYS